MGDYRTNGMEKTDQTTLNGETIYREIGSGKEYYQTHYGEVLEHNPNKGNGGGESSSGGTGYVYNKGDGTVTVLFIMAAIVGFLVRYIENHFYSHTYFWIIRILLIGSLVLPFIYKKKYVLFNNIFIIALMFKIFPIIDERLGSGSNSSLPFEAFLFYGLNSLATSVIVYIVYKLVRIVQKIFKIGSRDKDYIDSKLKKLDDI